MRRYSSWNVLINQVNFVVRANMVSVTVWQLKMVVAYWQLVVVKDAKFWLPNSDKNLKTSRNSRLLVFVLSESEFRGAFCYNRKKKNSEEKEDHADFWYPHPSQCGRIRRKRTRRARLGQGNGCCSPQYRWFWQTDDWACHGIGRPASRTLSHAWLAPHWGRRLYSWSGGLFTWTAKTSQSCRTRRNRSGLPLDDGTKRCPRKGFSSSDSIV